MSVSYVNVVLMTNNWGGAQMVRILKSDPEVRLRGIVLNIPSKQKYVDMILDEADFYPDSDMVIDNDFLQTDKGIEWLKCRDLDFIICAFYQHLLPPKIFKIPRKGTINLHPAYLPYCRGWHMNEYPILEPDIPAGVTIHYIDEGIDTGKVIANRRMPVLSTDTGGTLHRALIIDILDLFDEVWEDIKNGNIEPRDQSEFEIPGVPHKYRSIKAINKYNEIDLDRTYTGRELINILRARTYLPYPGPYFIDDNGEKVHMWIELMYEDELERKLPEWK